MGILIQHFGVLPIEYRLSTKTCMDDIGCFSIDGEYSLRPFNLLPQHRSTIDTKFIIYTPDTIATEYHHSDIESLASNLDFNKGFIILIHGWFTIRTEPIIVRFLESLVETKSATYNIMLVDWSWGSLQPYQLSASNTRVVGAEIARLLNHLQTKASILDNTHLIGISLGAHIAGYCGSLVPGIGRITALDAAGPLFENYPESMRLDPSDAKFVDAIHTDGDDFYTVILCEGGLGIHHSIGHADFYPNGGLTQPFCSDVIYKVLMSGEIFTFSLIRNVFACDHELSIEYFRRSLYHSNFTGFACHDDHVGFVNGRCYGFNKMGMPVNKPAKPTKYYLHMSDKIPFQGFHYQLSVELQNSNNGPIALRYQLLGDHGTANQTEESEYSYMDTSCKVQTAMIYSTHSIGQSNYVLIKWEEAPENTLSEVTLYNIIIRHSLQRYCSLKYHVVKVGTEIKVPVTSDYCDNHHVESHDRMITECYRTL